MKLSEKSLTQLHETIQAYYDSDGEDGAEIADQSIEALKNNVYSFSLWDALGSDELGYVAKNKQLQNIYTQISKSWSEAAQSKKVC